MLEILGVNYVKYAETVRIQPNTASKNIWYVYTRWLNNTIENEKKKDEWYFTNKKLHIFYKNRVIESSWWFVWRASQLRTSSLTVLITLHRDLDCVMNS